MNFLTAIINALVGFVQRNPLTVLVILILAIAAPALAKASIRAISADRVSARPLPESLARAAKAK